MAAKKEDNGPRSRIALIRLMEKHGDVTISVRQARLAGACDDVYTFRNLHFPGRKELRLAELVPFVQYEHLYDRDVKRIVLEVMRRRGILPVSYLPPDRVMWDAAKPLPQRFYVAG